MKSDDDDDPRVCALHCTTLIVRYWFGLTEPSLDNDYFRKHFVPMRLKRLEEAKVSLKQIKSTDKNATIISKDLKAFLKEEAAEFEAVSKLEGDHKSISAYVRRSDFGLKHSRRQLELLKLVSGSQSTSNSMNLHLKFLQERALLKKVGESAEEVLAQAMEFARPSVRLIPAPDAVLKGSFFVPQSSKTTTIAVIALSELAECYKFPWLPSEGYLQFRYSFEESLWGCRPDEQSKSQVIFLKRPPDRPEMMVPLRFECHQTLPSLGRLNIDAAMGNKELARNFLEMTEARERHHQIGGYPQVVQGDEMELEAEALARGESISDSKEDIITKVRDWQLLLQIASDSSLRFEFSDSGTLYFWVDPKESVKGIFKNSIFIVQSM